MKKIFTTLATSYQPETHKMFKKICLLSAFACLIFSCNNDDEDLIAICEIPTNISSSSITNNSAVITWNSISDPEEYILEYGVSGFNLGTGTTIYESSTTAQLNNLQANTTYDVYIKSVCSTDNLSSSSEVHIFTTLVASVITEFRTNLSELNLFSGDLDNLEITVNAFQYDLSTTLFSDYANKQRIIALPEGTSMEFDGDGLPIFPENTLIAKTFYYNHDERDVTLGKKIIETRVLIKTNGSWETGNYKWNTEQTDAILDPNSSTLPISWIDKEGNNNSITYKVPSNTDCFTCHSNNNNIIPIGPKLRSMNFEIDGVNQLEQFITNRQLTGITNSSSVRTLPNWEDENLSLETRARAYIDINCAHCHIPGGTCSDQSTLNFALETPLDETNILQQTALISYKVSFYYEGLSMPFIGTTIRHDEGLDLVQEYVNSL
ncbi:fibronectin type III domain-containing protein [Winogradskyella wichelsiae]|uniref:fibronectin type III domain-containing protein n=1 Tax=Winogradskyella wichelsiae TaxID=2697007 RepID=UPI0015CDEC0C|nr:fibronectin type III domain-containing protein [Winogradskyella wichelsiae]